MGHSSQSGQVGFGLQSVKGAPVAATRFARLRSGSLGGDRTLLIPDPEIGGHRDIQNAYKGVIGFSGDLEFYPRMQMVALLLKAVMGASSSSSVAGTNEVQTITITGTPTGGTFKLRFRGQTTTALDWDATAAEVDAALGALSTIGGAANVTCAGGPGPGTPITVTFAAALAASNPPMIQVVDEVLSGGTNPGVTITASTPGSPPVGTHLITPADTLPWLTIEERIGNTFESFQYTDGKCNSLRLEADAQGFLMGSASLAALSQVAGFTAQVSPDWDESPMITGSQVLVRFNNSTLNAKSFNFEIGNNVETDDFSLGSIFLTDMVEKRRQLTVGFTHRPQDSDLWRQAMYGDASFTEAEAGPAYTGSLEIEIVSFETINGQVGGTPYSLGIEIPDAVIAPFGVSPSGDDVIQADLELTGIRPDSAIPLVSATVVNDLATIT